MNFTVFSLIISSESSSPIFTGLSRLYCLNTRASCFFTSFLETQGPTSISKCRFEKFIHTSLIFASSTSYSGYYSSRPSQPSSGDVSISSSLFINCSSSTEGGAIYQYGGALTIASSTFISCLCTTEVCGGAIEATGTSFSCSFCCGFGCFTYEGGQFLRAVISTNSTDLVNFTSSTYCAPLVPQNSLESMINSQGYPFYYYCNASNNCVAGMRSAFATDTPLNGGVLYCTAANNSGTSCVRLFQSSQICNFSNFYNNSGYSSSTGGLFEMKGTNIISACVFISNANYLFYNSGTASVYNCVFSNTEISTVSVYIYSCSTGVSSANTLKLPELHTYMCNAPTSATNLFTSFQRGKSSLFAIEEIIMAL